MTDEGTRQERFTDEDLAFLRYVRFGELPVPVRPEELVALSETEPPRDLPVAAEAEREWGRLRWGA